MKRLWTRWSLVFLAATVLGCGDGGGGDDHDPDTTPPTVTSVVPSNGATDVVINAAVTATFSEAVNSSTVTAASFRLVDGSSNPVSGAVSSSGATATFVPSTNLALSTSYTATITTAVKDGAGNALVHDYSWTFTTGDESDVTPPTVQSTVPAMNAGNVAVNASISATFGEPMDPATVTTATFTLKNASNQDVSGTVNYSGTTATFTPSASLTYSTSYTATLTTGAKDLAGNALATAYSWTFTTGAQPDTTSPTVQSTTPENGASSAAVNSALTASFSEAMDPATVTTATFTLKNASNQDVSGTVKYSGTTATFAPNAVLAYATSYTATVTTGAKDLAGNALATAYSWTFTTGAQPDTTPPTVVSMTPSSGAANVPVASAVTVDFSEAMDLATITTAAFTLKSSGNEAVSGSVNYSGNTATFTPNAVLAYATSYTATVTTGAEDLAGNALEAPYSWTFTTESSSLYPVVQIAETANVNGVLTNLDVRFDWDGSYAILYEVTLTSPGILTTRMESSAFDAFLWVWDPAVLAIPGTGNWPPEYAIAWDDDGGGGTESQLVTHMGAGTYVIAANSAYGDQFGAYTLSTSFAAGQEYPVASISPTATVNGTLALSDLSFPDGSKVDLYEVTLPSGGTLTIQMSSSAVDSYLFLYKPDVLQIQNMNNWGMEYLIASDDDSGSSYSARTAHIIIGDGDYNARIAVSLTAGTYVIAANCYPGETGSYTLTTSFAP